MSVVGLIVIVLACLLIAFLVVFIVLGKRSKKFTFDIGGSVPRAAGGVQVSPHSTFKTRIIACQVACGAVIATLATRLWNMQLLSNESYIKQAEMNRTRTIALTAARGRILDRNGEVLVANRPSLCVCAQPHVQDDPIEVRLLSNLVGIPEQVIRLKIQDTAQGPQKPRCIAVDISRRVVAFVSAHQSVFEGVYIEDRSQRSYPKGSLAAHVLGYTGAITEEQIKAAAQNQDPDASDGSITYETGDIVGQAGVEAQYENVLQGIKGEQVVHVDADGNILNRSGSVDAQAGSDVVLTLDSKVQQAAETALQTHLTRLQQSGRTDCRSGCAIVVDVTNGDIIALASAPTFSPNVFVGGISNDDWDALSSPTSNNPLLNRAIGGLYPSASTIKPLSAIAALNYGISTFQSTYMCTGFWTGFGKNYGQYCWLHTGHGPMTLQSGITYSCDVVFYEIGKGFFNSSDNEGLQKTFKRYGLGALSNIDLPGEVAGRIPDAAWKEQYFSSYDAQARAWRGGDLTNLAIGQGDLLITPLQLASAYCAIATGGTCMKPHILKSIKSSTNSGSVIDYKPEVRFTVTEDEPTMSMIHTSLTGVIYEESQAQAAHFTNMKEKIAGKTGTAETNKKDPTGWFVAYAPADKPRYVVVSLIENGGFGGDSALYVVRDILGALYNEPDTASIGKATRD